MTLLLALMALFVIVFVVDELVAKRHWPVTRDEVEFPSVYRRGTHAR